MSDLVNSTILACAQTGALSRVMGAGRSETSFYLLQSAFYTPMNKIATIAFSNMFLPSSEESKLSTLKKLLGAKKITSKEELKAVLASIGLGAACALPATMLSQGLHQKMGYEEEVETSLAYQVGTYAAWTGGMALMGHLLGCLFESLEGEENA